MHHFGDGDDWVLPKMTVTPNEIARGAWKLRMCYYDENGEMTASREPKAEEIVGALWQRPSLEEVMRIASEGGHIGTELPEDQLP